VLPTTIGNSIKFLSKIRQHAARPFSSPVFFTDGTPADTDANELLPLEDELTRYYFAEHITGPLSLNKEDISTLGKCLQRMLVLDPRNRAPANVLLQEPWFARGVKRILLCECK